MYREQNIIIRLKIHSMKTQHIKNLLLCFGAIFSINQATAQKELDSERDLNNYAYSNTNLQNVTNGYVLDWEINYDKEDWEFFYSRQKNNSKSNLKCIFNLFGLLEKIDINNQFETDSILFPVMTNYFANDGYSPQYVPLFIFDMEVSKLKSEKAKLVTNWENESSYPQFQQSDFEFEDINTAGVFVDTMIQNYIHFYWNDKTIITNKNRTVEQVELIINNETIKLDKNTPYDISSFYDEENTLEQITIKVTFSDGEIKLNTQNVYLIKTPIYSQTKGYNDNTYEYLEIIGGPFDWKNPYDHTELQYRTHFGCDDQILDKPFIILAGWGTFTDNPEYNQFNNGAGVVSDNSPLDLAAPWPTNFEILYNQFNIDGMIDKLREANYDVIIARFLPPNSSLLVNSLLIQELLDTVNARKIENGSFEENILMGYSFGAVGARHALLEMENDHLNGLRPHHHTKLYVSFEGEHAGANIPLGAQHCVEYLNNNIDDISLFTNEMTVYTLHFLINSTSARQMMTYHFSQTGSQTEPGSDAAPERYDFINSISSNNHAKNSHNPNYPSFCRNISISNGQNESSISGTTNNHTPYPSTEGVMFFERIKNKKKWEASFYGHNTNHVFKYTHIVNGSWSIVQDEHPGYMLVLDNAPGGAMFNKANPMLPIMLQMKKMTGGTPDTYNRYQFCFTPTIFTHDIKNYSAFNNGHRLHYDFKEEGLMFQHVNDILDNDLASNFYGYPHLKHPNNHYTDYTPFDAIFTWSKNTVHIRSTEVALITNVNHDDIARKHPIYDTLTSDVVNHIVPFIMAEADIYNSYIQNRKYGFNANPNSYYKVDVFSPHHIFIGSNVTQRTNFKEVEVQHNANLHCQAAESISIKPGFYARAGSVFHAEIEPYGCETTKSMTQSTTNSQNPNVKIVDPLTTNAAINSEKQTPLFLIYPNPSTGLVHLELQNPANNSNFTYQIYNLSGKLIYSGQSDMDTESAVVQLNLEKGMYLVHLQQNNTSYTQKLVVY